MLSNQYLQVMERGIFDFGPWLAQMVVVHENRLWSQICHRFHHRYVARHRSPQGYTFSEQIQDILRFGRLSRIKARENIVEREENLGIQVVLEKKSIEAIANCREDALSCGLCDGTVIILEVRIDDTGIKLAPRISLSCAGVGRCCCEE